MASFTPRYITAEEIQRAIDLQQLMTAIQTALGNFSRGSEGEVVSLKSKIYMKKHEGEFAAMSGYSEPDDALACKLNICYPDNPHLPTKAYILLFDSSNGHLNAIMEGPPVTHIRTALASAIATKYLANPDSKVLALIGAGAQARSHYRALTHSWQFDEVRIYSRTAASREKLAAEIGGRACGSAEEAVRGADIICVHTFSITPVLMAEWVKPGAHINGVGACSHECQEIETALMTSSVVYVDSREDAMKGTGDIIISKAEICAEIGEVINGTKKAHWEKTTVFKSVGIAIEDVITAQRVYDKCCKQ